MRMKKLYRSLIRSATVLLLLFTAFSAMAQKRVVTGTITDAEGAPIPGVNVILKGTTYGTTTDGNGAYSIEAADEDVLQVSFIGFTPREIRVGAQTRIDVSMAEDVATLQEVVVIGYGESRRSDLTGALASISGEKMRNTITTNIDQALQGRIAGVQVTQNSGQPGGAVSIRIRGTNSITGSNEPLYVIDGIQFQDGGLDSRGDGSTTSGFDWAGGANGQTRVSPLSTISPNDIESIEVLKDASATAIYGSRGANGVIIITTKRGKSGEAKISYSGFYSLQTVPKKLDMMTLREYAEYQVEVASELQGGTVNERFLDPSLLGRGTDWQEEVFRKAGMQSHQISLSGGNDNTQYAIMGGFFAQDGIIIGSGFERFNTRINLDNKIKEWFKVGASLGFANTDEKITQNDGGDGVVSQALQMGPHIPVRDLNGVFAGPGISESSADISANPVALALIKNNTLVRQRLMANFYGDVNLLKNLSFRSEIGFDYNHSLGKAFVPTYEWGRIINPTSQLKQREESGFYWIWKNYFTYKLDLGVHNVSATAGYEAQRSQYEGSEVFKQNFASNDIPVLSQGENSDINTNGWKGASTLASFFGRVNYNFSEKYLATVTLRADGSSKFGPNNRWGYFPQASLAWRVSNESFMPVSNALSDLKFRVGYGIVGNQAIPDYAYGSKLRSINSAFGTTYINDRMANPDVKWESTAQYNIGMDLSLFGGRVDVTADIYKKYTKDMLLEVSLPDMLGGGESGVNPPYANVGRLENQGLELSIVSRNIATEKITWNTDVNFTLNRNLVKELDRVYTKGLYWYAGFDRVTRTTIGYPVGVFYGYITEGLFTDKQDILGHAVQVKEDNSESVEFPNGINYVHDRDGVWPGDVKFKDLNGDGKIDENDQTIIGDPNPDFTFGFNNSFSYGPFDLTINLVGSYGAEIFSYSKFRNESMSSRNNNQAITVKDRARIALIDPAGSSTDPDNVRLANPGTVVSRFTQLNVNGNTRMSDRWIEDGSYVRIQNINLAYTLPKSLTQKFKVERCRIYAVAQNVYTFTNYTGYDPEIGAFNQDAQQQNIDMGRYPAPRVYTIGIDLDF